MELKAVRKISTGLPRPASYPSSDPFGISMKQNFRSYILNIPTELWRAQLLLYVLITSFKNNAVGLTVDYKQPDRLFTNLRTVT